MGKKIKAVTLIFFPVSKVGAADKIRGMQVPRDLSLFSEAKLLSSVARDRV